MAYKEDNQKTTVNGGIGFVGLLQIAFIVLKLCNIIDWSWFWVLAPTWMTISFWIVFILVLIIIASLYK